MRKKFEIFMVLTLFIASFFLARAGAAFVDSQTIIPQKTCIVIDAGHGANDPGKIGVNGASEKDINLSLALKLRTLLENKGIDIVMTRESDEILADSDSNNVKREDMNNRVRLITESNPIFTISIHQNSYTSPSVCGPQVFYYQESLEGKQIAQYVQDRLDKTLEIAHSRGIKANSDYYLLKKTSTPTIIVECGFLSNPTEAELLCDELYQDKIVRSLYLGICDYLESIDEL